MAPRIRLYSKNNSEEVEHFTTGNIVQPFPLDLALCLDVSVAGNHCISCEMRTKTGDLREKKCEAELLLDEMWVNGDDVLLNNNCAASGFLDFMINVILTYFLSHFCINIYKHASHLPNCLILFTNYVDVGRG